jgi:hypothetical protein
MNNVYSPGESGIIGEGEQASAILEFQSVFDSQRP